MIPIFRPSITELELEAVTEVMKSGWLGTGQKVQEFEERFAEFVGVRHAVAVNSGTAALHLALKVVGVGMGSNVVVPALTFVATAHAAEYCKATPVFCDVDPNTLCICAKDARAKMNKETDAVVPVHFAGLPSEAVLRFLHDMDLDVIEDCAHACGAAYGDGRKCGSVGRLGCFSFHAVKNMTTGSGGMITTNDTSLVEELRRLRWCGISKDTYARMGKDDSRYGWFYEVHTLGYNFQMTDIQAALGIAQLSRLEEMNAKRRELAERYFDKLGCVDGITLPPRSDGHSWHAFVLRVDRRDEFVGFCVDRGIHVGVHYMPIHLHPYYTQAHRLGTVESLWQSLATIPLFPDMTQEEQDVVVETICEFYG